MHHSTSQQWVCRVVCVCARVKSFLNYLVCNQSFGEKVMKNLTCLMEFGGIHTAARCVFCFGVIHVRFQPPLIESCSDYIIFSALVEGLKASDWICLDHLWEYWNWIWFVCGAVWVGDKARLLCICVCVAGYQRFDVVFWVKDLK